MERVILKGFRTVWFLLSTFGFGTWSMLWFDRETTFAKGIGWIMLVSTVIHLAIWLISMKEFFVITGEWDRRKR